MQYTEKEKKDFHEFVNSLKKYRRAEVVDGDGNDLLKYLYTDLLPSEQILKTCLSENTTFIVGRKGTGKSTIFLKMQQAIRGKNNQICCYIDAKTIFETSKTEYSNIEYLNEVIPKNILQSYLIERMFIQSVLTEISEEIDKKTYSALERFKKVFGIDKTRKVKERIKDFKNTIENNEVLKNLEIPMLKKVFTCETDYSDQVSKQVLNAKVNVEAEASVKNLGIKAGSNLNVNFEEKDETREAVTSKFSEVFITVFQINEIIRQTKEILSDLGIKHLIILLDDFSEIDEASLKIFVDVILAPLNNWSDDFIKFKVAAYPHRIHYGKIDLGKVDIIELDFYNLYSEFDRNTMEERAIDFTKRLLDKRIEYFTKKPVKFYFDTSKENLDYYYELIFKISMNVPRIIGYILFYCYETNILYDKPINRTSLEAAAQRYYEKVINPFFGKTTYSMMANNEKISILQLKELLDKFLETMKYTKKRIAGRELTGSAYVKNKSNPFVSHFYVNTRYENFLKTLELNFFISKYDELTDRDAEKVIIYCLNFGLCTKNNLGWGKPTGYRKYFIERPFNFNKIMDEFLTESKNIECINPNCGKVYPMEQLEFLKFTKMQCVECQSPVQIVSISETIKAEIEKIDRSKLLNPIEYGILYELHKTGASMRAKEIAQELDCSYQLIGKKAKQLYEEKGLIERNSRNYTLTAKANIEYF